MSIHLSKYKITFLTLCASILTACGGGGDEQVTNVVNTNPQPRILVTDDWQSARLISTTNNTNVSATVIGGKLNINIQSDSLEHAPHIQVYLDTDNNAVSGFQFENQAWDNSGVDYIIEDGDLFKSTANDTGWNWNTNVGDISYTKTNNNIEIQIDTDLLGNLCNTLNIGLMTRDTSWYVQEFYPVSSRMSNFSISYCQTDGNDTQAPMITLNGANPLRLDLNSNYSEAGAVATDNIDGDVSGSITTSTNLDTSKVGTYTVTYSVSDTSGNNSTETRTVIVSEASSSSGITVDGNIADWSSIHSFYNTANGIVKVSNDENKLYLLVNASQLGSNIQFFIDADNSLNTGLKLDLAKDEWTAGADYMIENNSLDKSTSNLPIWAWDYTVAPIEFVRTADAIEVAINKSDLVNLGETIVIGFISRDADWNVNYAIPEGALNSYTLNSSTIEPPVVTAARYRLTFNSTWSIDTHPVNFPQGNPHFSPLVGAVHNSQLTLWQPGEIASTGIENMAESGSTSALISEILDADSLNNSVLKEINGSSIPFSPGSTSLEFDITPEYPEVSFTSMLAPSPDWFVGVHNLNLFENGTFIPTKTVSLKLYDAGTDSGLSHTSGNADTQPKQAISLLTSNPTDASFINGGPILGSFTFERISITEE